MNAVVRNYLQDGMIWSDKKSEPHVVIKSVYKFGDQYKVEYSVFVKDKRGIRPHMENITCTIHLENLMPYIRDNKLNELGI